MHVQAMQNTLYNFSHSAHKFNAFIFASILALLNTKTNSKIMLIIQVLYFLFEMISDSK